MWVLLLSSWTLVENLRLSSIYTADWTPPEKGAADPSLVTVADCRAVQDHSYRLRRHSPQVAEWYYRFRRNRDEHAMKRATERKISQL